MKRGLSILPMILAPVLIGSGLLGCGGGKEEVYGEIASVYAEVLVAQLMYGEDTLRRSNVVDSILNDGGYETIDELYGGIATITADDPRGVRIVLDSTQARLEEIRDGKKKGSQKETKKKVLPEGVGVNEVPPPSDQSDSTP